MTQTITYSATLSVTQCWCGIYLAVPDNLLRQAHDHGREVYCPLGHKFSWSETEADRQRKRAEKAETDKQWYQQRFKAERDLHVDTQRRLSAQRGATTRAKKRSAAALCPCCNRSFVQLRRHMATKHPDYDPTIPSDRSRTR